VNYYGAKELAESFRTVRKNTINIAQDLPEEKYSFRAAPNTRSVGEILAHISLAYNFQHQIHGQEKRTSLDGFNFPALMRRLVAEEKLQRSKEQVIEMLRESGEKWAGWVEGLTDSFLVACRGESVTALATPRSQKQIHAWRVPAIWADLIPDFHTNDLSATGH
jgi:hypothetical protein